MASIEELSQEIFKERIFIKLSVVVLYT